MLEIMSAPEGVIAMRASGYLDENDIERAIAAFDETLAARDRIAIYAELDVSGIGPKALWPQ